jgi:putative FmdB family regulatory protein
MPIFEFHCPSCNSDFEQLVRSFRETKGLKCPTCQSADVSRKISVFSAHAVAEPRACPMPGRSCDQCCGFDGACKP